MYISLTQQQAPLVVSFSQLWRSVSPCWFYPSSWLSLPAGSLDRESSRVSYGYLLTRHDLYHLNPVAQRIACKRLLRTLETNTQISDCLVIMMHKKYFTCAIKLTFNNEDEF